MSKDFKDMYLPEGTKGFLSSVGFYGYWYPERDYPVELTKDCKATHLSLWKNQDPFFCFSIEAENLALEAELKPGAKVCVWFDEKTLVKSIINI